MAYGMLTSFALGAAQGLGSAIVNKYSKDQDAEIAAKAAQEREARIEEASIRAESRAITREQSNYTRGRADTLADTQAQHDWTEKTEGRQDARELVKTNAQHTYDNDSTTLAGKAKVAQIAASNASTELQRHDLETKRKVLEAGVEWEDAKTPEAKQAAEDKVKALTGKIEDGITLETSKDIIGYDDKGKPITSTTLYWVDKRHQTVTPVDMDKTTPLSKSETKANSIAALAKANAVNSTNYTGYQDIKTGWIYDTDAEKEEYRKKEEFNKVLTQENATNTGMLGRGKVTAEAGKVSNTESLIRTKNAVEQQQLDSLFNIIKAGESGGKGVNAGRPEATPDNPHPTAGGTFQITNDNLKSHGIKPTLPNGEYSAAQKDAFAPTYYKEVYEKTGGNQAAMVAAGFGQESVYKSIEKAKANGSNSWWDYLDKDGFVEKNMPIIKDRIKQQQKYLVKNDIPVPVSISDFRLNNK